LIDCCCDSPGGAPEQVPATARADVAADGAAGLDDDDDAEAARIHRLQRQDAKSRKTFKIKRNRSTLRASSAAAVARSATVKVRASCQCATYLICPNSAPGVSGAGTRPPYWVGPLTRHLS